MPLITLFFCALFFLLSSFFLTAMLTALTTLQKKDSKTEMQALGKKFYYRPFHLFFFPDNEYEGIYLGVFAAQNFVTFCFAAFSTMFLLQTETFKELLLENNSTIDFFWIFFSFISFILLQFIIGYYLPRIFGTRLPKAALYVSAPISSFFLFITFPLTFLFLKLSQSLAHFASIDLLQKPSNQVRQEIIEMIDEIPFSEAMDAHEKKLIESVLSFKERIVREVMVPRVDLFCIDSEMSIREAAKILHMQGFSRTPVYRNSIDNIVGVVMYKDLFSKYLEYENKGLDSKILDAPIESIQKNILYVPETKKLSSLLQEFRKKQVHAAIVVDEYGGTEGIVTIEDILEVIVGDISDEYDEEEALYQQLPDGSFVVDARMSILDVEEILNIHIPQDADYDTIGGYIYQTAGTIPQKGFIIHRDDFELEVLSSSEKSVEQVKIKLLNNPT